MPTHAGDAADGHLGRGGMGVDIEDIAALRVTLGIVAD